MGELGRKAGTTRGGENQDKDNNNTANDDEVVTQSKELYRKQLREQHFRCVPLYPGQGGFNPCVCWTWCCGGRCTLRTGCYLTAFLLTVNSNHTHLPFLCQFTRGFLTWWYYFSQNIGLFYVAYSLPKVTNFVITTSGSNLKPESVENQKEFRTTFEKYFADIEVLLGFLGKKNQLIQKQYSHTQVTSLKAQNWTFSKQFHIFDFCIYLGLSFFNSSRNPARNCECKSKWRTQIILWNILHYLIIIISTAEQNSVFSLFGFNGSRPRVLAWRSNSSLSHYN